MLVNLIISKSKNSKSLYIQKSFRKNGKSTSKVVRKLGTMEELLPQHNNSEEEVIAWGRKIAKKMTDEEKRDKDIVLIQDLKIKKRTQNVFAQGVTQIWTGG